MDRNMTVKFIVYIISALFVHNSLAGVLESQNHKRPPRSLGSMNFGNQAGNMGPNGIQGMNNAGPMDGIRNPERPQLESIYRGNVLWGNPTRNDTKYEMGHGRWADEEVDQFGNPIRQPKKGPRPELNPKRKEDTRREKRAIQQKNSAAEVGKEMPLEAHWKDVEQIPFHIKLLGESALEEQPKAVARPHVDPCRDDVNDGPDTIGDTRSIGGDILRAKNKAVPRPEINPLENNIVNDGPDTLGDTRSVGGDILRAHKNPKQVPPKKEHAVQKRDVPYVPPDPVAMFQGPVIESRYKGPPIMSQYTGPPIRSEYTGQIRSQYMGPPIMSEYKGKIISMLGGVKAYEDMVAKRAERSTQLVCLAEKYREMNEQLQKEKIRQYVRNKPKLRDIYREP